MPTPTNLNISDGAWRTLNERDVYMGPGGDPRANFVPAVGDVVVRITGNVKLERVVMSIDPETMIPRLAPVRQDSAQSEDNAFYSLMPVETMRTPLAYLDTSVTPHDMSIDGRLVTNSPGYVKVFAGKDITSTGTVISAVYDAQGNYVGENVPLEPVDSRNTTTAYRVPPFKTNAELSDGAVVTAVRYSPEGIVNDVTAFRVVNQGYTRRLDAGSRTVVGISLESAFLSVTAPKTLDVPANTTLSAVNLLGVVRFSNGSSIKLPVDGTRFVADGLDSYAPASPGATRDLVIKYNLGPDENANGTNNAGKSFYADTYKLRTVKADGRYSVQLYPYPEWNALLNSYTLRWFLYDLSRSTSVDVTNFVTYTRGQFNPTIVTSQLLEVSVNLGKVNTYYRDFNHIQRCMVALNSTPTQTPNTDTSAPWVVTPQAGSETTFGVGAFAKVNVVSASTSKIKLSGGYTTLADWLKKVYGATLPMFDQADSTKAPDPTHLTLLIDGQDVVTIPLEQWNQPITILSAITGTKNAYVKFIRRTATTDLQLSIAALPIRYTDENWNYL
jgi:hypothetical protein